MIPIGDEPAPSQGWPVVNLTLILANIAVFAYELSLGDAVQGLLQSAGVVPLEFTRQIDLPPPAPLGLYGTTLITSMFLHAGLLHIGSNMLYLWIFGDNVEARLGHARYLLFYFLAGLGAGAAQIFFNANSQIPSVGASGAIAGVLAGYLLLFPSATIRTLIFLGPFITFTRLPALILIGIWFVTQLFSGLVSIGRTEQTAGVAFWAHVGGFVVGLILVKLLAPRQHSYEYVAR
ncbi:MAG: rhomboid family intramembrane serine protease [Chloroflexi bacterium]|nr:rhomboid family intramembrane serine protease [Chloroflexota bacterium]